MYQNEFTMGRILKDGIVISFVNQKGGVGKSTIASIFANHLFGTGKNENMKLNIAVIDADDLQQTLYRKRQRELASLEAQLEEISDPELKQQYKELENTYQVLKIASKDIPNEIDSLKDEFDIILIDLPGNMKQEGVITDYFLIDIMLIPFQPNEFDIDSTIQFYNLLMEDVVKGRQESGLQTTVAGLINRVNPQTKEFKDLYENRDQFPFPILTNYIKESKVAYQRNINTLGENYDQNKELCDEILQLIFNHQSNG